MKDILKSIHIPDTISEEAKKMLNSFTIQNRNAGANLPKANASIKVWEQRQKELEIDAEKSLPKILELYEPIVETIFLDGIRAIDIKPKNYKETDKVIIYIHGGGFVFYSADVTLLSSIPLADTTGIRIITIDPKMALNQPLKGILRIFHIFPSHFKFSSIKSYIIKYQRMS